MLPPSSRSAENPTRLECVVAGCTETFAQTTGRAVRLCQFHKFASSVLIGGKSSRYCKQCSRLHLLDRFKGDSHSCEKRLAQKRARRQRQAWSAPTCDAASNPKADTVKVQSNPQLNRRRQKKPQTVPKIEDGGSSSVDDITSSGDQPPRQPPGSTSSGGTESTAPDVQPRSNMGGDFPFTDSVREILRLADVIPEIVAAPRRAEPVAAGPCAHDAGQMWADLASSANADEGVLLTLQLWRVPGSSSESFYLHTHAGSNHPHGSGGVSRSRLYSRPEDRESREDIIRPHTAPCE